MLLYQHFLMITQSPPQGGYDHYMAKEIHEQPESTFQTMRGRIRLHRSGSEVRWRAVGWRAAGLGGVWGVSAGRWKCLLGAGRAWTPRLAARAANFCGPSCAAMMRQWARAGTFSLVCTACLSEDCLQRGRGHARL